MFSEICNLDTDQSDLSEPAHISRHVEQGLGELMSTDGSKSSNFLLPTVTFSARHQVIIFQAAFRKYCYYVYITGLPHK
jgi:hypothetical protein